MLSNVLSASGQALLPDHFRQDVVDYKLQSHVGISARGHLNHALQLSLQLVDLSQNGLVQNVARSGGISSQPMAAVLDDQHGRDLVKLFTVEFVLISADQLNHPLSQLDPILDRDRVRAVYQEDDVKNRFFNHLYGRRTGNYGNFAALAHLGVFAAALGWLHQLVPQGVSHHDLDMAEVKLGVPTSRAGRSLITRSTHGAFHPRIGAIRARLTMLAVDTVESARSSSTSWAHGT